MVEVTSKRLSFEYRTGKNSATEQGTIHCELLVFERGSWVALPVYSIASETVNNRRIITGFVESQTDQKFRALLSYCHPNSKRTSKWHIDHHLLCAIHVDGRKKPVCEYTIRQNAHENPVDLTGCATAYGLPFANVPSEQNQSFSWQERSANGEQIACRSPGISSIDDHSSISFKLSKCDIHRVVRDKTGRAAFPSTQPSLTPSKRDKDFEPVQGSHRRLSHYVQIAKTGIEGSSAEGELVPEFEVTSGPFVEFKFYYKSRDLLESLEIARGIQERPRRGVGIPISKSVSDLPYYGFDSSASSSTRSAQATPATPAKRKLPQQQEKQRPSSRTITSRLSPPGGSYHYTGLRPAPIPSPELPQPSHSSPAIKRPRLDDRHPTPYPRPPASASPPRRQWSSSAQITTSMRNGASQSKHQADKPQQETSKNSHDQADAASLPSPPASPVQSAVSDASLPSLADLAPRQGRGMMVEGPQTSTRPTKSGGSPRRSNFFEPREDASSSNAGGARASSSSGRLPPSRSQLSPSRNIGTQGSHAVHSTQKRHPGGRPPLIPNLKKTPTVRKEPSAAEADAVRAALLRKSPTVNRSQPAQPTTLAVPPATSTPTTSGQGSSSSASVKKKAAPADKIPQTTQAPLAESSTSTNNLLHPSSSPAQKPDVSSITAADAIPLPQAGPSTPRASAPAQQTTPVAKEERRTPKVKHAPPSSSGKSAAKVKEEVIDLTLDSEAEEEEEKKDIKKTLSSEGIARSSAETTAEIRDRKNASDHATDLLNELDIFDVGNIQALVNVGYKSTATFVTRLPLLDATDRRGILEELTKEMGKLDFGILRAYLKRQGVELEG